MYDHMMNDGPSDEEMAKLHVLKSIQKMMGENMAHKLKPTHMEEMTISAASPKDAASDDSMVASKLGAMSSEHEPIEHDEVLEDPKEEMMETPHEEALEDSEEENPEDSKVARMLAMRFGKKPKLTK